MAIQMVKVGESVNDGTGDPARTCFTKINQNFTDTPNAASRLVGTDVGNVMEVGAFGVGGTVRSKDMRDHSNETSYLNAIGDKSQFFYAVNTAVPNRPFSSYAIGIFLSALNDKVFLGFSMADDSIGVIKSNGASGSVIQLKTSKNTSIDGNGFIKAASPIVKLFADKIELNDEAAQQKITFEKLGVGDYLIKGSTGLAQEGWYIEMPKDANGNVLVAVIYAQLDNNDISVKTYAKMFDEETGDIVPNTARPRDIPATRWIDLRLQALPQPDITPTDNTVTTNAE